MSRPTCRCHPAEDDSSHCLPTWQLVPCRYCGQHHEPGTECPDLELPGTEWDQ